MTREWRSETPFMNTRFPVEAEIESGVQSEACQPINIVGMDEASVQAYSEVSGGWPASMVLTVEVSNNARVWNGFPTAVTISAAGITDAINVTAYAWLRVRVSTKAASAPNKIMLAIHAEAFPRGT